MLLRCAQRVFSSSVVVERGRVPWLDSNAFQAFLKYPRVAGGHLGESLLSTIAEGEIKIQELDRDLKDQSMADLKELVLADIESAEAAMADASDKLRQLTLIEMDKAGLMAEDKLNARIEVRAGVGGDEAHKWAQEIFEMYSQVSARLGWSFQEEGEVMRAVVVGEGVYGWLRFESGVHRVQRIPFNSDRMQTSAAAVYVVPKIQVPRVHIRDSDLKIHISKKSSGAGGQSVNAAYQQVRMTHLPSGYTVVVNESHAQQENREMAFEKIQQRVQLMKEEKALAAMALARRGQVRTADRSEKVRSYNFQRSEINDHRLSAKDGGVVRESCDEFMADCGSLVTVWERLKIRREDDLINDYIIHHNTN